METTYIIIFIIFIVLYIQHRNEKAWIKQKITKKRWKGKCEMLELAKRFLDKECIIYTFNSQISGAIKEVSEGAIVIESNHCQEVVNLDFVVRIREYPRNKKGKKKSLVLD